MIVPLCVPDAKRLVWLCAARAPDGMLRLVGCVLGVWLTWSAHDYLQERIFRVPGFTFGIFMAFCLQATSFVLSLVAQIGTWLLGSAEGERERRAAEVEEQRRRAALVEEEQERGLLNVGDDEGAAADAAEAPPKGASWPVMLRYLLLSLLIAGANGCATAALNYVSMVRALPKVYHES